MLSAGGKKLSGSGKDVAGGLMGISYNLTFKRVTGRRAAGPRLRKLIQQFQTEYLLEDRAENAVAAIRVAAIA